MSDKIWESLAGGVAGGGGVGCCVVFALLMFLQASGGQQVRSSRAASGGAAVQVSGTVSASTAAVLRGLASRTGVIFAGHVVGIERNDEAGYVDVVFSVDTAVRGCTQTSKYVLREWAGLWSGGQDRYVIGQRLLMLLAARGPSGMSAPVGGMAGRIPLVGLRPPPLARGTGVAPADTPSEDAIDEGVDLRWVQTLAVRATTANGNKTVHADWAGPVLPMPVKPPAAVQQTGPTLRAVLSLLGGTNGR